MPNARQTAAPDQPLVYVLIAVAAGIAADRLLGWGLGVWWSLAVAGWSAWLAMWWRRPGRSSAAVLLVAAAAVAGAWHHCCWSLYAPDDVWLFARGPAHPAAVEVQVVGGPRWMRAGPRDPLRSLPALDRTLIDVELLGIRDRRAWRGATGRALLLVNGQLADLNAGDRLRVFGQLTAAHPPDNPGEFDFAQHARAERRASVLHVDVAPCVTRTAVGRTWRVPALADRLRRGGQQLLHQYIAPRYAGLAAAMFLGVREDLEPEDSQAFLETGTVHLLVVSGLNVGLLAATLWGLLRIGLLPRGAALAAVATLTVAYALVTDMQPPVVRAAVMVLVACGARAIGRRGLDFNSLAAAALVVLCLNPADLFRAGPQLSFLAVAALSWWSGWRAHRPPPDPLDRLIARTRPWPQRVAKRLGWLAWESVAMSSVIWLVVSPLVLARFHLLSPAAVVLGPLLSLPVSVAMATGFGILATGGWLGPVAALCGLVCQGSLECLQRAVAWGQTWRGGHFWLPGPSEWWLAGFYLALAMAVGIPRLRPPRRWAAALTCAWVAVGVAVGQAPRLGGEQLTCTVLSVGHGSAVVLELPGGRTLLYDAGHLGPPSVASRAIAAYLWSRGRTHLDAVVLSHADSDHYNALPALTRQFSIGAVYVSPVMFENPTAGLQALQHSLSEAGIVPVEIWAGDRLRTADATRIEVLHPPRRGVLGSDNANSIVLAVEYAGRRLLLTGDLESPGLDDVLAEEPWDCDLLLAPHHGSASSAAPKMAAWCRPEWTLVSGSEHDQAPSVQTAYAAYGEVLHTARRGAIQAAVSPRGLDVRTWRTASPPAASWGR